MITISPPMAASQAADYYQGGSGNELLESFAADEIEKSNFQVAESRWSGEMAAKFDLKGEVGQADFEKVLDGINPIDEQPLVRHRRTSRLKTIKKTEEPADEEIVANSVEKTRIIKTAAAGVETVQVEAAQVETSKTENTKSSKSSTPSKKGKTSAHRACWDITFSAPKSVSLAAIVGGDLRLIEVQRQAVTTGLREVEKFAEARRGGNTPPEKTGKLLIASFEHYTARPDKKANFAAADLHTHNPLMNFTITENGKSYALQPQKLFAAQKLGTAVYRLELAKGMNEIGYEIRFDEKTKAPEIAAISREYIEAVSPRQAEIKAKAKELNINSTRQIVFRHRSAKTEKSADSIEFHRRIEKSFDDQASAAVKESLINTKLSQPAIIERLENEVTRQRTKIFEKAEKRRNYYAARQLSNQNNEQTRIEGKTRTIQKTRTIEDKVGNIVVNTKVGNENNRTENDAVAVVPISRNPTIAAGRQFDGSNIERRSDTEPRSNIELQSTTEFQPNSELREEIADRSGGRQIFSGTKRDPSARNERSGRADQESREQNRGNKLENSESFRRDESFGSEHRFDPEIDRGKASEFTKSNSSESSARSRTDGVEAVAQTTQSTADQTVPPASRFTGAPKTVARSTADRQPDGVALDNPLRADQAEPQFAGGNDKLSPEDTRPAISAGVLRVESTGNFRRELSKIIANVEVGVESLQVGAADFDYAGQSGDNLAADFSDSDVLAINHHDAGSDYRNHSNLVDLPAAGLQPHAGAGIDSDDCRIDNNPWDNLLPLESELERSAVRSEGVEFFSAEPFVNGFSDDGFSETRSGSQFTDQIPNKSGFSPSFSEIEQIFETQNRQETLAEEIVRTANEQRLQNQQTEINQAVQEKMFAYLMQLTESPAPNTAWSDDASSTALAAVHQDFLINDKNLEQFTQAVEERHLSEEKANRTAAENSAQNTYVPNRSICIEEIERYEDELDQYEDDFEFEEERGFSLSL